MVSAGRQDWHEAQRAVAGNCDRDGVLAAALKLITELVTDLGMSQEDFRAYAGAAITRT